MKRTAGLTVLRVRRLTKPGRHADGGGLYLAVSDKGAKSWVFHVEAQQRAQGARARLGGHGVVGRGPRTCRRRPQTRA